MADRSYVFRLLGEPGQLQAATEQAGQAIDALAARTTAASSSTAVGERAAAAATNAHGKEADAAGKSVHSFSLETAAAKRELIVLAHELSQGNYKKFGGSILVLAEQTGAASLLFSAMGVAILGATAAVGGLAFAMAKGAAEQTAFNRALVVTGNAAGVTASSFDAMVHSIAASSGDSVGHVHELAQAFLDTGKFGPSALDAVTRAAATLQKATGDSAENVVKQFAKMTQGATAWAEETNKQYHFLDVATYDHIKALEDQGRAQDAMTLAADSFDKSISGRTANLGTLAKAWNAITTAVGGAIDAVKNFGKDETTGAEVDRLQKAIAARQAQAANRSGLNPGRDAAFDRVTAVMQSQLEDAQSKKREENLASAHDAYVARVNEEAIAGSKRLAQIELETDKIAKLNKELADNKIAFDAKNAGLAQSGSPQLPQSYLDKIQDDTRKKYAEKTHATDQSRLDDSFAKTLAALGSEGAKLDSEIQQWTLYGRAIDNSRVATTTFAIEQGKLVGKNGAALSAAQREEVLAKARAVDAKQATLNQDQAATAFGKRAAAISAAADAQAKNSRETEVAAETEKINQSALVKGSQQYKQAIDDVTAAVNRKHDAEDREQLAKLQLATDEQVQKLDEETRMLGLSTVERQKALVAIQEQAKAQQMILKDGADPQVATQAAIDRTKELGDAIDRNYAASRQMQTGIQTALNKYAEEATNEAAFGERVVSGIESKTEDFFTQVATTGKGNLKDLFNFMYQEYARNLAKMAVLELSGKGSGGSGGVPALFSAIGGLFSSGSGVDTAGTSTNFTGSQLPTAGGRAGGGSVAAGSFHPVNENGPELLGVDGKDYLMMGGKGGYVTPVSNRSLGGSSSSGGMNVVIENHAGAQITPVQEKGADGSARLRILVKLATDAAHARVANDVFSGTGKVSQALSVRGVNLNGSLPKRA